jgi:hypothetical protein
MQHPREKLAARIVKTAVVEPQFVQPYPFDSPLGRGSLSRYGRIIRTLPGRTLLCNARRVGSR